LNSNSVGNSWILSIFLSFLSELDEYLSINPLMLSARNLYTIYLQKMVCTTLVLSSESKQLIRATPLWVWQITYSFLLTRIILVLLSSRNCLANDKRFLSFAHPPFLLEHSLWKSNHIFWMESLWDFLYNSTNSLNFCPTGFW